MRSIERVVRDSEDVCSYGGKARLRRDPAGDAVVHSEGVWIEGVDIARHNDTADLVLVGCRYIEGGSSERPSSPMKNNS